jgi:hypothetical protein
MKMSHPLGEILQQVSTLKGSKTKNEIVRHHRTSCNGKIKDFIHEKAFIFTHNPFCGLTVTTVPSEKSRHCLV